MWVLGCTGVLVLLIGWLYLREQDSHRLTHKKLDYVRGEVQSAHDRQDFEDQRMDHAHSKLDKLRSGIALLFKGETREFLDWWRSWYGE